MIPVARVTAPATFGVRCRKPGLVWLAANPKAKRPRDYWTPFKPDLAAGFASRCGYAAMYEPVGSVDHFKSWDNHPDLAYEWSNYRFASEWLNKSKQTADEAVLDPYEVKAGWFEISLPDLQLRVTDRVPPSKRRRAEYTLTRLHLRDDERVLRQRRQWYAMYQQNKLTLEGLDDVAPLIAEAVRKQRAEARKRRSRKPTEKTSKRKRMDARKRRATSPPAGRAKRKRPGARKRRSTTSMVRAAKRKRVVRRAQ